MSVALILKTEEAKDKLLKVAVKELNSAGESMVSLRKQLAPRDSGWMAERTRIEKLATEDDLETIVLCDSSNNPHRGGNNEAYDLFVEYGTINQDAQPSATPSYESAKRQLANVKVF